METVRGKRPLTVAAVTGGHPYDVPNFHKLMRETSGVEILVQHMDDFASSPREVRQSYAVVLFYIMFKDGPSDDLPWYSGKPRTALEELGETEQGIVVLHHATLAYPQWLVWNELVGIQNRSFGYHPGQTIHVDVANREHPITKGLKAWEMSDETYTMADAGAGNEILLSVNHPKSMKHIAWARQYKRSRVFNFQSGHDNTTWADPNFREILRRGILWTARAI